MAASSNSEGRDLTVTVGKFFTNPQQHAFSKIAGEVGLCIDVRSHEKATLALVKSFTDDLARVIADRYGVCFELGVLTGSEPAIMDRGLIDIFDRAATASRNPAYRVWRAVQDMTPRFSRAPEYPRR